MRSSRFSEERIIGILKEQEAGMPTVKGCRRHVAGQSVWGQAPDTLPYPQPTIMKE